MSCQHQCMVTAIPQELASDTRFAALHHHMLFKTNPVSVGQPSDQPCVGGRDVYDLVCSGRMVPQCCAIGLQTTCIVIVLAPVVRLPDSHKYAL